jgi:hypothetical protein
MREPRRTKAEAGIEGRVGARGGLLPLVNSLDCFSSLNRITVRAADTTAIAKYEEEPRAFLLTPQHTRLQRAASVPVSREPFIGTYLEVETRGLRQFHTL